MTALRAWLADVILGPRCPSPRCNYRARGPRSMHTHTYLNHREARHV